jgi:hypothetical protein
MHPIFWEQKAFLVINTPFRLVGTALLFVLTPVYLLMQALKLPLLLLLMVFNLVWVVLVGSIMALAKLSKGVPSLRPVSFVIALPFLLVGDFLVTISPAPMPSDAEAKLLKWQFLESFPYCTLMQ